MRGMIVAARMTEEIRRLALAASVLLAATVALSACGVEGGESAARDVEVRDSAGVRVVVSRGAAWGEGEGWRLASEPRLAVGVLEGDEARMFANVAGADLLSDGTLVVADGGSSEIRAFASDGALHWRFGGPGEGPGEFGRISKLMVLPGDTVMVWDISTRRATLVAPDGSLARTYPTPPPEGRTMASPVGVLSDGQVLVSGGTSFSGGEGPGEQVVFPTAAYYAADLQGAILDSLFQLPTSEMTILRGDGGSIGIRSMPFGRRGFVAASGPRIATARSGEVAAEVFDGDGVLQQRISLMVPPRSPTADDRERYVEHRLEDVDPEAAADVRRRALEVEFPEAFPAVAGLALAPDGSVWLERWRAPWEEDDPTSWWVFAPDGAHLGTVEMPAGLDVQRITEDAVVGVEEDELGVERVVVVPIER